MKIAVVGCGALGSFYGAKLCALPVQVHFLLRSDYDAVRAHGVKVESFEGDFSAQPLCARVPEDIGPCDLVLIGLKTTANEEFRRLLPPLVHTKTALLTLQNGLGNEEALATLFNPAQVFGGLCFVCLNRIAPGLIRHTAHGDVVLGEYQRPLSERGRELCALLERARIRARVTDNLERTHWEKLVWNIPFNGLGVAGAAGYESTVTGDVRPNQALGPCLSTDQLLTDPRWFELVRTLMREVITAARALGMDIPFSAADLRIEKTRQMGPYKASTLIDYERGQAIELESLFLKPLQLARQAGVATPRLASLCQVLVQLSQRVQG